MEHKFKIRHENAKKILRIHCEGIIKNFAKEVGKSEQQCSNFLRDKKPANIGDRVATSIEKAFGYPPGWLDLLDHESGEASSESDIKLFKEYQSISNSLKKIDSIASESTDPKAHFISAYVCSKVNELASKLYRSTVNECMNIAIEDFSDFMLNFHGIEVNKLDESRSERVFTSNKHIFFLEPSSMYANMQSRHRILMSYQDELSDGLKPFSVVPFHDGKALHYHFSLIRSPITSTQEVDNFYRQNRNFRMAERGSRHYINHIPIDDYELNGIDYHEMLSN